MTLEAADTVYESTVTEFDVFWAVARSGALTTRRVIREFGPKPNWGCLIRYGHLKEYQTAYGAVLAVGTAARKDHSGPAQSRIPYLTGPNSVADRAYQMDALKVLIDRGYTVHHHDYKRSGKVGSAAREGRRYTDQILSAVMQVPPDELRALHADWPGSRPYRADSWGTYPPALGYPTLYASISSGGIRLPKLRALYKKHERDIKATWQTPLLIAVPEEGNLRAYIRAEETAHRRLVEQVQREGCMRERDIPDLIRLVIVRKC